MLSMLHLSIQTAAKSSAYPKGLLGVLYTLHQRPICFNCRSKEALKMICSLLNISRNGEDTIQKSDLVFWRNIGNPYNFGTITTTSYPLFMREKPVETIYPYRIKSFRHILEGHKTVLTILQRCCYSFL